MTSCGLIAGFIRPSLMAIGLVIVCVHNVGAADRPLLVVVVGVAPALGIDLSAKHFQLLG